MAQNSLSTPLPEVCKQLTSAQKNGEMCDLVLACNGQTIAVHKLLFCVQSPVMKAACTGPFVEASGTYEIKDCSFETIQRLVEYLYTGNYSNETPGKIEVVHEVAVHVAMFSLADKYLIDGLLTLSETKFRQAVKSEGRISVLLEHVKAVYDLQCDASKALRNIMVDELRQRITRILGRDATQALQSLFDEIPDFAKGVATSYVQQPFMGSCPRCQRDMNSGLSTARNRSLFG
ncbi:BTB/POZ protein [Trichoderma longibrachiatum]|uniref:BTB domain-containing protein n=1 Tax=Trichoderma longibrachiatum ATCC 18648 TaxID=983965 RepID=A0A2T4BXF3_TRILO|nr:hypothetical protein M440DRAFT_1404215 [Trichoderma longibrachiatum ATCC 18648]